MSQPAAIRVRSLRVGQPMPTDLTDANGVLLLRAGVKITQNFIDTLLRRGVTRVATRPASEPSRDRTSNPQPPAPDAPPLQTDPGADAPSPRPTPGRLSASELNAMAVQTERAFDDALDRYIGLGPELIRGGVTDLGLAADLVRGFEDYLEADPTLVLMLLRMRGDRDSRLFRHGIKSALLSMALARQMEMDAAQVTEAGVAALVHDLGMLRIPAKIREAPRELTPAERLVVREHPTFTLQILDKLRGVSDSIKTAAYQVHERCDASGYPRGRSGQFLHPLAKVIAVADTYAALTDDRPQRPACSGHEAMKAILHDVQAGRFDRAVARALVDTLSMYPVGTLVGLSDGRQARVLRGVPGQSVRPVVVVLEEGRPAENELDLGQAPDLAITRVLPEDAAAAA